LWFFGPVGEPELSSIEPYFVLVEGVVPLQKFNVVLEDRSSNVLSLLLTNIESF
jgi:hypothetical protein